MILYGIEFTKNLVMAVGGNPKIEYKKGAQVIVSRDDYLRILKYGGKPLGKVQLTYKDLEKQLKASIEGEKKAAEEINAERIAEAKRLEEVRAEKKKEQEAFEKKQADMKAKHEAEMKKLNAERLSKAQKEKSNSISNNLAASETLENIVKTAVKNSSDNKTPKKK